MTLESLTFSLPRLP